MPSISTRIANESARQSKDSSMEDILKRRTAVEAELGVVAGEIRSKKTAMSVAAREQKYKEAAVLQEELQELQARQTALKQRLGALGDEQDQLASSLADQYFADNGYHAETAKVTRITVVCPQSGSSDSAVYVDEDQYITLDVNGVQFERQPQEVEGWVRSNGFIMQRKSAEVSV